MILHTPNHFLMCFWGNVYYIVLEVLSSRGNEIRVYRLSKSLEKIFILPAVILLMQVETSCQKLT